jgi:ribosomal protein S18 acetylase RimI-like enzyme
MTWKVDRTAMQTTLRPLTEAEIEPLMLVGTKIWESHYVPILGAAQVAYMTGMRFTVSNLRRYIGADDRWLDVLRIGDDMVGYCSYALTSTPGEMKLEQLYLLPEFHGRGLGGKMLRHVADRTRAVDCRTILLQVNKNNSGSIEVYKKTGFTIREEAVFDIGGGFVMDDYLMEKRLS